MSVANPFAKPVMNLQPIGFYKSGRPIYPILGGSEDAGSGAPGAGSAGDAGVESGALSDQNGKQSEAKPGGDEPLGEPGLKALRAERQLREQLEAKVKQLEPVQDQMKRLAEVFGGQKGQASTDDVVAEVQKELAELRHENAVSEVARVHKIDDADDLSLLRDVKDREQMERLAKRLAATAAPAGGTTTGGSPRPDPSAGRGGGDDKTTTATVSAGRDLFRDRHKKN